MVPSPKISVYRDTTCPENSWFTAADSQNFWFQGLIFSKITEYPKELLLWVDTSFLCYFQQYLYYKLKLRKITKCLLIHFKISYEK